MPAKKFTDKISVGNFFEIPRHVEVGTPVREIYHWSKFVQIGLMGEKPDEVIGAFTFETNPITGETIINYIEDGYDMEDGYKRITKQGFFSAWQHLLARFDQIDNTLITSSIDNPQESDEASFPEYFSNGNGGAVVEFLGETDKDKP